MFGRRPKNRTKEMLNISKKKWRQIKPRKNSNREGMFNPQLSFVNHGYKEQMLFESPIERKLYKALMILKDRYSKIDLRPQHYVWLDTWGDFQPGYRLDFAVVIGSRKIDIECDGKQHKFMKVHDEKRDRALSKNGWEIVRIPGHTIHYNEVSYLVNYLAKCLDLKKG